MTVVKKTDEFIISKRRDGRYAVTDANRKPINGDDKTRVLLAEGLIKTKLPEPEPVEEKASEEGAAEESSEESAE